MKFNIEHSIPSSHFELDKFIVSYYDNNILRIKIKSDKLITVEDLPNVLSYIDALDKGPFLNLFEFYEYASVDDQIRNWASDPSGNKRTIADAIVIHGGLDQKILGDAYMNIHKPIKPTQVFDDVNKAVNWLLTFGE